MKQWIIGIFVLALAGALIFAFINGQKPNMTSLPENAVVYDVRTPDEYALGHVTNAMLLPLSDIQAGKYPEQSKDTPIAVYCRSGNRSAQATELLKKAGFKEVIDIGSFENTQNYGLSTVK